MKLSKNSLRKRAFMILAVMMTLIIGTMAGAVYAEDSPYAATWNDYKATGAPASTWNDVVDAMEPVLDYGKEAYASGDADAAYKAVSNAYYGFDETTGFERIAMGYISGSRKSQMELQFSAAKAVAKKGGSVDDYNAEVETLKSMLREDANILDGSSDGGGDEESTESSGGAGAGASAATATFIACFSIILREGFEAILIVGAIIAYLAKSAKGDEKERKRKVRPVYLGSLIGILASFVLAWLLNQLKLANSASQEIIEGITALTAVVVLYYVSNWMLSKSETDAWTAYIKSKAEQGSESGSLFALAATAFLAVFREGAEVVLFFQPMLSGDNISSVWMGFIIGCIVLVFVYLAIHFLSIRIPIKPFFTATSVLMFIMSISFLGAGIKELIEGEVIGKTSPAWLQWIPSNDFMEVLGIYPCLETLVPQLILLVITVIIFVRTTKKNQEIHAKAEAERAAALAIEEAEKAKAEDEKLRGIIREVINEVLVENKLIQKKQ